MDIKELYNTETRDGIYIDDANRPYDEELKLNVIRSMMKGIWTKVFHREVRLESEMAFIKVLLKETNWVWNQVFPEMPDIIFDVETEEDQFCISLSLPDYKGKQRVYIERKPLSSLLTRLPLNRPGFYLRYNAPLNQPILRRYSDSAPIHLARWRDESEANLALYQDLCKTAEIYQEIRRFANWARDRYEFGRNLVMVGVNNSIPTTELVKGIVAEVEKLKEEFVVYRIDTIDLEGSCSFACLNDGSLIGKEVVKDATNFSKLFDCLNSTPDEIKRETCFYVKKGLALSEFIEYVVHLLEKKKKELNLSNEEKEDE